MGKYDSFGFDMDGEDEDDIWQKKQPDPMDFSSLTKPFKNYTSNLAQAQAATGGGDGTGFPSAEFKPVTYNDLKDDPSHVAGNLFTSGMTEGMHMGVTPIKDMKFDPVPAINATRKLGKTFNVDYDIARNKTEAMLDVPNATVDPDAARKQLWETAASISKPDSQFSADIGNLGIRAKNEFRADPDHLEQIARELTNTFRHDYRQTDDIANTGILANKEASVNTDETLSQLSRLFSAEAQGTAEKTNALTGMAKGSFDPNTAKEQFVETLADMSGPAYDQAEEEAAQITEAHQLAQFAPDMAKGQLEEALNILAGAESKTISDTSEASVHAAENRQFDAGVAKTQLADFGKAIGEQLEPQAQRVLERQVALYDAKNLSFNQDVMVSQIRDYAISGSEVSQEHKHQFSQAMNEIRNSRYGNLAKNITGSFYGGGYRLAANTVESISLLLAAAPQPEFAMFTYQQMLKDYEDEPQLMYDDLNDVIHNPNRMTQYAADRISSNAEKIRAIMSEDYKTLKYLTMEEEKAAWMRPDRLIGDTLEYVVPAIVNTRMMMKGAASAGLQTIGQWYAGLMGMSRDGFLTGTREERYRLMANRQAWEKDDYYWYCHGLTRNPEKAQQLYVDGKARQAGALSGLYSAFSYAGSHLFRGVTATGTEGIVLMNLQQFVLSRAFAAGQEAVTQVDRNWGIDGNDLYNN